MLGFYITGHPLDQYMDKVKELATHITSGLEGLAKSTEVAVCGILTGITQKRNKKGDLWAALQVEDLAGSVEAMVFSTQYERLLPMLQEDKAVLVRAWCCRKKNAAPKLSVQDIVPLEVARLNLPSLISIRVPLNGSGEGKRASALHELFARKPGETEVRLRLEKTTRLLGYPGCERQSAPG